MARETLEIEIGSDGAVSVHVKGRKGAKCLDLRDLFQDILGPVDNTTHTDEFYEQEDDLHIVRPLRVKNS